METKANNQSPSKSEKVFHIVNYILMISMTLLCMSLCIYYVTIGDPNNRVLASIGVSLLFLVPILIELIFRCRISNLITFCYVLYSILAGVLGCVFNFYNLEAASLNVWYDIFIHTLAGYVFCFIALILISRFEKYKNLNPWTIIIFCICFTLAIELIWELLEWFADSCFAQNSQGFAPQGQPAPLVTDTNIDMLCNFSGAVLFAVQFIIGKFTKFKLGVNYIEKELCGDKIVVKKPKRRKNKVDTVEDNQINTEVKENIETIKEDKVLEKEETLNKQNEIEN